MTTYFEFYHAQNNPRDLTSQVGGPISTTKVKGALNELFVHVDAPPSSTSSTFEQYRKIYIKNDSTYSFSGVKVWLTDIEHSNQISIGFESSADQSIASGTLAPGGVTFSSPTTYTDGIAISGTVDPGFASGLWIKQTLTDIDQPDNYATIKITVGGIQL